MYGYWLSQPTWSDDEKMREVKAYRRKSDHYEKRVNDLDWYIAEINKSLNTYYNYSVRTYSPTSGNNPIKDIYVDRSMTVHNEVKQIENALLDQISRLKQIREEEYDKYIEYYNLAESRYYYYYG